MKWPACRPTSESLAGALWSDKVTQFGTSVSNITGDADNPGQSSGTASKTDRGFGGYNGTWEVGNWGDTLHLTN